MQLFKGTSHQLRHGEIGSDHITIIHIYIPPFFTVAQSAVRIYELVHGKYAY